MDYISNSDGSATITWNVPVVTLSTPTDGSSQYFDLVNPTPLYTYYDQLLLSVPLPGGENAISIGVSTGCYLTYGIIHIQYGTDPSNTIRDYYNPMPTSFSYVTNTYTYVQTITSGGGYMSINLSPQVVSNPKATNGIYAVGYVGFRSVNNLPPYNSNFMCLEYASVTNALSYTGSTPSVVTNIQANINNNQYVLTWDQTPSSPAPIVQYKISWSTLPNGPFANNILVPAQNNPTNTYSFPTGFFPFDGQPRYFIIQAIDDGSAIPNQNFTVVNINYSPPVPSR
jgi:hypothetical protein